jgi:hypothetical protein
MAGGRSPRNENRGERYVEFSVETGSSEHMYTSEN